ncbi:Sensor histidine kinase RegB [Novipirellula aureliae]|uniref:histidine kinase n=1 Tax=Novipirellula aureliae TaxID=2527966 RepID=A0A5C6DY57_9BACT|nr:ATP-binding protein [Novipirellula aureliae]TWU41365.1 Sensor histidine kinase RegB [Novipirellula aureliae]
MSPARLGSSTWLLHLRWMAVAGQIITIFIANLLVDLGDVFVPLILLVGFTAITNVIYLVWLRYQHAGPLQRQLEQSEVSGRFHAADWEGEPSLLQSVALAIMLLDLLTLTIMLYFSGGADNPFTFFYFVNLAVGGVMIRPKSVWLMPVFAVAGYMILLRSSIPVEILTIEKPNVNFDFRASSLLFAFSACAAVVTYYVTQTAGELQRREEELRRAQADRATSYRLEGLTTLAAGAAHELATPLSTIDVIVREMSRHLEGVEKPQSVNTDLQLIDGQLEMCKQILARMRSAAGDSMAQQWDQTNVGELIDTTLEGIRDPHRVDIDDEDLGPIEDQTLWVPREAIAQAFRNLIHNGLDASPADGRVQLDAKIITVKRSGQEEAFLELTVQDSGQGMSEEVLERAGDPFFTTKEPGRGIGLGLFLTRNVISQLGGELVFESTVGHGTKAIVRLPMAQPDHRKPNAG